MNIRSTFTRSIVPEAQADINRVAAIWIQCRIGMVSLCAITFDQSMLVLLARAL